MNNDDVLLCVDCQNDFFPGGGFGVPKSDLIIPKICSLINLAKDNGCKIYVTRDYHPNDHISFINFGGPFPPHCIQGHHGSFIQEDIAKVLHQYENNIMLFKACKRSTDSFSAIKYTEEMAQNRISCEDSTYAYTGAFALKCSNIDNDINAPPDVFAYEERRRFEDILAASKPKKIYVCGLALDYCVEDTLLALRERFKNSIEIYCVMDCTCAVNTDLDLLFEKFRRSHILKISSNDMLLKSGKL